MCSFGMRIRLTKIDVALIDPDWHLEWLLCADCTERLRCLALRWVQMGPLWTKPAATAPWASRRGGDPGSLALGAIHRLRSLQRVAMRRANRRSDLPVAACIQAEAKPRALQRSAFQMHHVYHIAYGCVSDFQSIGVCMNACVYMLRQAALERCQLLLTTLDLAKAQGSGKAHNPASGQSAKCARSHLPLTLHVPSNRKVSNSDVTPAFSGGR